MQPLSGGTVHEVSAALNDGDEGDEQDGEELHHGANLPDPGRQVQVARVGGPVEHLVKVAKGKGHDGQDDQSNRHDLQQQRQIDYPPLLTYYKLYWQNRFASLFIFAHTNIVLTKSTSKRTPVASQ